MIIRAVAMLAATFVTLTASAEMASIHLNDGSILRGEVVSLKGGNYVIESPSVGRLSIPQVNITLVEYAATTAPQAPATPAPLTLDAAAVSAIQQQLMNNPDIMQAIIKLQSDPAIQSIVQDPEVRAAMSSGNVTDLMNHPKVRQLIKHPEIQKITGQIAR